MKSINRKVTTYFRQNVLESPYPRTRMYKFSDFSKVYFILYLNVFKNPQTVSAAFCSFKNGFQKSKNGIEKLKITFF